MRAKIDKIEGRKLFMTATLEDAKTGVLQADSSTLFIQMKLHQLVYFYISKYLLGFKW